MEGDVPLKNKGQNHDVVVEIGEEENSGKTSAEFQENGSYRAGEESLSVELCRMQMNLIASTSTATAQSAVPSPRTSPSPQPIIPSQMPIPIPDPSAKPPLPPSMRRRSISKSAYSKPKSRIAEPPYPTKSKPAEANAPTAFAESPQTQITSPNVGSPSPKPNSGTPKTSAPITPRTPLMASIGGDEDDDDDDDVYKTENFKIDQVNKGKKVPVLEAIEWIAFVCIMAVLIASLTVNKFKDFRIWSLKLWKWCVLVLVIFCGRLFTEWLSNTLVFLIEKNFLLKKKVLYFVFSLKKSVRIVVWLALILVAWVLLINRGVNRSEQASKVLNYITRGIASTLVGAAMWMLKTLLIKLVASSFHVRTYFDRIQESIFHQYILQALSRPPMFGNAAGIDSAKLSGQLSFNNMKTGKQEENGGVINVDKLYKIKREKISAWTMGGLIRVIGNSELTTISEVLHESIGASGGPTVIKSEVEAREAANRIFRKVAKHSHKYIEEDDLLTFMPKEEVDNAIPLFEGAAESRRIKKSAFRNWVVKAYNERKCLAVSLSDANTAIKELNKIASALTLLVIVVVWLLLMEITTTKVLVFISSQLLLVVFMFGNTAKTVFEAIIFVFVVHPFDVGDRCVIDGQQLIVDEMNILTTVFLKPNSEKVYYPNAVLATQVISNFNRSPEMMGDSVEFAVDFSTSVESIAALKGKIKAYLDGKPQRWNPGHSVLVKEIVDVNKMVMVLYVTHTINFQNVGETGDRRSDLILELKKIFEELGIEYHLLPQEVQISYVGGAMPTPTRVAQ